MPRYVEVYIRDSDRERGRCIVINLHDGGKSQNMPRAHRGGIMYRIEQEALIYIVKQLPKMGITYRRIEKDLTFITSETLYNYASGRTKPKGKKFAFLSAALKEKYPLEYDAAKAKFEAYRGKAMRQMIIDEINSHSVL